MIRRATLADVEAVATVHVTAWIETYTGLLPADLIAARTTEVRMGHWREALGGGEAFARSAVFLATDATDAAGEVVGFGCCGPQRTPGLLAEGYAGEVQALYVLRSAQGMGHGRGLMAAMAAQLAEDRFSGVSLWALRDGPACGFYERLGGRFLAEREDRRDEAVFVDVAYGWRDLAAAVCS